MDRQYAEQGMERIGETMNDDVVFYSEFLLVALVTIWAAYRLGRIEGYQMRQAAMMLVSQKELLGVALEALEESVDMVRNEYAEDWRHGMPTRAAQLAAMKNSLDKHVAAIAAIRTHLGEQG
jgi:hypothetical protein